MSRPEELHPRYLQYCRKTSTVTFLELWHRLGTEVSVLVTSLIDLLLVEFQWGGLQTSSTRGRCSTFSRLSNSAPGPWEPEAREGFKSIIMVPVHEEQLVKDA